MKIINIEVIYRKEQQKELIKKLLLELYEKYEMG